MPSGQCDRDGGGCDHHQHAGGVRAALGIDVGAEDDRDENAPSMRINTSGRTARAQCGAIPYLGRKRGIRFSSPAIADAPANHKIAIVEAS